MEFELPEGAKEYFDREANVALASLVPLPAGAYAQRDAIERDPRTGPIARSLNVESVELIAIGNPLGIESQQYFSTGQEWVGLNEDGYPRFANIVSRLSERKELSQH